MALTASSDFNRDRDREWRRTQREHPWTGIACPTCGLARYDSRPSLTLTSWPPQKNVACRCGYTGFRRA